MKTGRLETRGAGRGGFTLIEILAVLLILSILVTFVVRSVGGGRRVIEMENTRAFLQQVTGIVNTYYDEFGRYPRSTFPADLDPKPDRVNMGAEMLVITLWGRDSAWQAPEIDEEHLGNTDQDATKVTLTSFADPSTFEIVDSWGNPIAYIHHKDYDKEIAYLTLDVGGREVETPVKGRLSPKTGNPFRNRSFQLISAGPDGLFESDDDIANFELRE